MPFVSVVGFFRQLRCTSKCLSVWVSLYQCQLDATYPMHCVRFVINFIIVLVSGKTIMEAQQEVLRALRLLSPPVSIRRQHVSLCQEASFSTRPGTTIVQLCPQARSNERVFNRAVVELQLVYPMNQLFHVVSQPGMLAAVLSAHPAGVSIGERIRSKGTDMTSSWHYVLWSANPVFFLSIFSPFFWLHVFWLIVQPLVCCYCGRMYNAVQHPRPWCLLPVTAPAKRKSLQPRYSWCTGSRT